jgi:hypothetical protein
MANRVRTRVLVPGIVGQYSTPVTNSSADLLSWMNTTYKLVVRFCANDQAIQHTKSEMF